jgi:hypothetical protein
VEQRFQNWWVASRFVVHHETFLKCDLFLIIEDRKYDYFETFETFTIENDVKLADGIITEISAH